MATVSLVHGKRYRARISLGFFERIASNAQISDKLSAAGFSGVNVWGSGGTRGEWMGLSESAELPSQVAEVTAV